MFWSPPLFDIVERVYRKMTEADKTILERAGLGEVFASQSVEDVSLAAGEIGAEAGLSSACDVFFPVVEKQTSRRSGTERVHDGSVHDRGGFHRTHGIGVGLHREVLEKVEVTFHIGHVQGIGVREDG